MFEVVAGRYVLIDSIGSGGSGEVWRAFDQKRGQYCAAKVIRHPEAATLVRAVFEQGVRLDHPHVVTPYAWAADDEQVLLAMPLVRGGSLAVLLRDLGVLPARYAAEVLRQLLVALEHVHDAGLVHRDVKPANVLLEATGTGAPHARLADFGLVLTPDRPRITGMFMVVGTRDYLAPESLNHGDQGVAQDLYAAGLVGAEMVGGHAGPLTGLIAALTAPEPERRPESATAALERLAEVLDGWPLRTPMPMPDSDEPVEVFEQIGELPPGWGPSGPITEAEAEASVEASVEAETASVEWLWSPHPEPGGATAAASGEDRRPVFDGLPGADQRAIPAAGGFGEWRAHGSRSGERRVPDAQAGGALGDWRTQGSQPTGGSDWHAQTVPFSGRPGGPPADRQADRPPVDRSPTDRPPADRSSTDSEPGGWQGQTMPLAGKPGGASTDWQTRTVPLGGRPGPPGDRQPDRSPTDGASGGWQGQTVPLPGRSAGSSGNRRPRGAPPSDPSSGDWQTRTVPLGGTSGSAAAGGASGVASDGRQGWTPATAKPDLDHVRLMPVLAMPTGAGVTPAQGTAGAIPTPATTAAPPLSRPRRRWRAMVAAAVAVLGAVGAVVVVLVVLH